MAAFLTNQNFTPIDTEIRNESLIRKLFPSKLRIIIYLLVIFIPAIYYLFFNLSEVKGTPATLAFTHNDYLLSERLSYMIRAPQPREAVIFHRNTQEIEWVGLIVDSQIADNGMYTVEISNNVLRVARQNIISRIWYPPISNLEWERIMNEYRVKYSKEPTPTISLAPALSSAVIVSPTRVPSVKALVTLTPTAKPTVKVTPTVTTAPRIPRPPQMDISYPSENQSITLTNSQQFCVVDVPAGGDQSGLQRRQNVNNTGWSGYSSVTTLCFSPNEGQNTISLQYKNSYGEESNQYDRHFSFHQQQEITVTLNGRLYSDNNCNGNWDSGEGSVNGSATVNIFKMPEFYILGTVTSNNDGTFNSFTYSKVINDSESLAVQAAPVSPQGYKSNPKYSAQTVTLNKDSNNYTVNIPQVPNENISACQ